MTSLPTRVGLAAAVAAGVLAMAGCGSGDDADTATAKVTSSPAETAPPTETATPAAEAAPATAPVPAALRGRWGRLMRASDFGSAGLPLGVWTIDVRRRAMDVYVPRNKTIDFTMEAKVDDNKLTLGTAPACTSTGSYTWQATKRRLRLTLVEDTCSARASLFDGAWSRGR